MPHWYAFSNRTLPAYSRGPRVWVFGAQVRRRSVPLATLRASLAGSTQVGFTRLARICLPISGKPGIGFSFRFAALARDTRSRVPDERARQRERRSGTQGPREPSPFHAEEAHRVRACG